LAAVNRRTDVFYAFGHQRLGPTLAAVTAHLVAQLVSADSAYSDRAPFSLERFS
jgi:D-hydroxyproline dehydrogenase